MLLRYLGETGAADRAESAMAAILRGGTRVACDLGGDADATEMRVAIVEKLNGQSAKSDESGGIDVDVDVESRNKIGQDQK